MLKKQQSDQAVKGPLVIEQIGIPGIPSLWMSSQDLLKQGYIPREAVKLLEKYHKMFAVLRCHKRWENERMFGRNFNAIVQAGQAPVEFQYFKNSKIVSKYNDNQLSLNQSEWQFQQLPLARQYIRSFFPPNTQGTSQNNYQDSENATYKMVNSDKLIIKQVLEANHVQPAAPDSQTWSLLWSCNALVHKQQTYDHLTDYQKINHFINSTELTRKDRLYMNFNRMRDRFGSAEFNYLPETYVLPEQLQEFREAFQDNQSRLLYGDSNSRSNTRYTDNIWIAKPAQSSRGRGIFLLCDLKDIPPSQEEYVVSKYISNPLLISGHKFDLRVYVLITSVDPLKIYVFNEGLVRFATEPYDIDILKAGKFSHLTNYSINKKSENFVQNKTAQERDVGNKWSLSALQHHLQKLGIDFKIIWQKMYDMIIKSLISVESQMLCNSKKPNPNSSKPSNCFELLGFDILLDSDLNPWILEVNLAPSLSADSPLDFHIKSNLVVDFFNLAGIRRPLKRNGTNKPRQNKGKSNSVAHNAEMSVQTAQTMYKGGFTNEQPPQIVNQKDNVNSQTNLMKSTVQGNGGGRNNMRKGNGTLSQGVNQGGNASAYFEYGQGLINHRKPLIGGPTPQPVQYYDGVEISILQKISKVSAKHRALLYETLWEFERNTRLNFTRIFPSPGTCHYDQFFDVIRPNNKLVYKYLCQRTELWAIIEQSQFNDLEAYQANDNCQEPAQQNINFEPNNGYCAEQPVKDQAPKSAPNNDLTMVIQIHDVENDDVDDNDDQSDTKERPEKPQVAPMKPHPEGNYMERRKTMSRKQERQPQESFQMPPLMSAQARREHDQINLNKDKQDIQMSNMEDSSAHNRSQAYEDDALSNDSSVNMGKPIQTLEPLQLQRPLVQSSLPTVQALPCNKQQPVVEETRKAETFSNVVVQYTQSLKAKSSDPIHPLTENNSKALLGPAGGTKSPTKHDLGKSKVEPSDKSKKLDSTAATSDKTTDKTVCNPATGEAKLEQDMTNIQSPKSSSKQSRKEPMTATLQVSAKSPKLTAKLKKETRSNDGAMKLKEKGAHAQSQLNLKAQEPATSDSKLGSEKPGSTNDQIASASDKPGAASDDKPCESSKPQEKEKKKKEKVVITGDDILIEYVRRIKNALKKYPLSIQPSNVFYYLERFLFHKVWTLNDQNCASVRMKEFKNGDLRVKLKIRYLEMKQRREQVNQMDKQIEQRAIANRESLQQYLDRMKKLRNDIVSALSSTQVEQMVIQSNQQNPIEIVSYLVGKKAENGGLLTRIERYGQKALANKMMAVGTRPEDERQQEQSFQAHSMQNVTPSNGEETNGGEAAMTLYTSKQPYQSTVDQAKGNRWGFESKVTSTTKYDLPAKSQHQSLLEHGSNELTPLRKADMKYLYTPKSPKTTTLKFQLLTNNASSIASQTIAGINRELNLNKFDHSQFNTEKRNQGDRGFDNYQQGVPAPRVHQSDQQPIDMRSIDSKVLSDLGNQLQNVRDQSFSVLKKQGADSFNHLSHQHELKNRFNLPTNAKAGGSEARSHTYDEPTLYKKRTTLQHKLFQAQQNMNIQHTNGQQMQSNMACGESQKSLAFLKQHGSFLQPDVSPVNQAKSRKDKSRPDKAVSDNKAVEKSGLDTSAIDQSRDQLAFDEKPRTGLADAARGQQDILSDQYTLKNQQFSASAVSYKPYCARLPEVQDHISFNQLKRKTTPSVDRPAEARLTSNLNAASINQSGIAGMQVNGTATSSLVGGLAGVKTHGRNYATRSNQEIEEAEIFGRPAPLFLPKITDGDGKTLSTMVETGQFKIHL